jgi:HD-GYP domain-containing protein (c-di-GMP phosphodiesterase class II)
LRYLATHALNTAQVAARLAPRVADFEDKAIVAVVAALLHDIGLATVPFSLLAQPTRLNVEQLRTIESHPTRGAEMVTRQIPKAGPMAEGIRQHHERLDGTGYPDGSRSIVPLARILAACDVYAAMLAPRPHRDAMDPRMAMTQLLLGSRRGQFDQQVADGLRQLGFYPSGSVVELHNGRIGLVVAPDMVALLTDAGGACLSSPCYVDLDADDDGVIRRALSLQDRTDLLGTYYPQLV